MADDRLIQETIGHFRFFEPTFERLRLGVLIHDAHQTLIWSNRLMATLGYCAQDLSSVSKGEPVRIDPARCVLCPETDLCRPSIEEVCVCRQHTKQETDGRTYTVIYYPLPGPDGLPDLFVHLVRDISDEESAFKERLEYQMMLANILDNTADAVVTLDLKRCITSWNRGAWQLFGYSKEEMKARHINELMPDDEKSCLLFNDIQRLLDEQGFVRNQHARMSTKERRTLDVSITQTVMQTQSGEPFGYSMIVRDITNVVRLETSLSQKLFQLTKLLQMDDIIRSAKTLQDIYTAILVAVSAGEGLSFNRAFLLLTTSSEDHLIGVQAVGPSSLEEAHQIYSRHIVEQPTLGEIIEQRKAAGDRADRLVNDLIRRIDIPLSRSESPLIRCLLDQRPYLFVRGGADDLFMQDFLGIIPTDNLIAVPLVWQTRKLGLLIADNMVTRRMISMEDVQFLSTFANRAASAISNIQLQDNLQAKVEELKSAYNRLAEIQEISLRRERLAALGEMSSKVAHEIRNPLTSIGGFARLLQRKELPEDSRRYITVIVDESARMERILNEVLGYVRAPSDDREFHDLNALIADCKMLVDRNSRVTFTLNLDPEIPQIHCNQDQIKQAILNIMQNGVEAMTRGGVMEIVSKREEDSVRIRITDQGSGIREEDMKKLFKPFFTTKARGVGLGLSVTKQIIDSHNGVLRVQSRIGHGTTFEIRLPLTAKGGAT